MNALTHAVLIAGGLFNLAFAAFHATFPRRYHWDLDLRGATVRTRQIVHILNLCLVFVLVFMAYVSLVHARELIGSPLGRTTLAGFGLFWCVRALSQGLFFGFKLRATYTWGALFLAGGAIYLSAALAGAFD